MKINISTPYDLHDKDIISYKRTSENLTISIGEKKLNGNDLILMNFIFTGFVGIKDISSSEISCFSEETTMTEFMNEVVKYNYEIVPENLHYKSYVFYNEDDYPCMEVIATDVKIIEEINK